MRILKILGILLLSLIVILGIIAAYPWVPGSAGDPPAGASKLAPDITSELEAYAANDDTIDAVVVASADEVLLHVGDTGLPINTHSVRKSVMDILIGQAVLAGDLDINSTLAELGIDDSVMPLTEAEKQARVVDLLKARSGIYIEAAGETPEMKAMRPSRGQYAPGEFYYYNNWDFNVLGSILTKASNGKPVAKHLGDLGERLGFQDYDPDHLFFQSTSGSQHDQYVMYLSARDLAAIGQMMLRDGLGVDGQPVVSADWIEISTTKYSELEDFDPLDGYGFLWSVDSKNQTYWATGWGGQYMLVDPVNNLVIVTRNDTGRRLGHIGWALAGQGGQGQRSDVVAIREMLLK